MKRKLIIITANDFLAYQPSILNLYDFLTPFFDISIISFEPDYIGKQKPTGRNIIYLKIPFLVKWSVLKFDFLLQVICRMLCVIFIGLEHKTLYYHKLQYYYLGRFLRGISAHE